MKITVIGCGYLGATHAACMAELGHEVVGVEIDDEKRRALEKGVPPFYEPGLADLLATHVESGRLRFTDSFEEAASSGDLHFLCVGTPQSHNSLEADVSHVYGAVESLAAHLDRPTVIAGKSTVPVGTAAVLAERIATLAPAGEAVELAWNPEFLREGFAVEDTLRPDRLVFGVRGGRAEEALAECYRPITAATGIPVVVTDYATAELAKVSANAFLATKISFINAIAEVCEVAGADIVDLADIMGHDVRIGRRFLNAGIGFGGGCLPKDIRALLHRAGELGVDETMSFLRHVDEVNQYRRRRTVDIARELLDDDVVGRRVGVWGGAFKPESDDIRDSPALWIAGQLQLAGADVRVYDPKATETARRVYPTLTYVDSALEAAQDSELLLHLTEWREFREIEPAAVADVVRRRVVLDGRTCLDRDAWRAAGWEVRSLGRP